MLQIRDLPLESCLAVRSTTPLHRVVQLAAQAGTRYILVRQPSGDVKGVQLATVAKWMKNIGDPVKKDEALVELAREAAEDRFGLPRRGALWLSRASVTLWRVLWTSPAPSRGRRRSPARHRCARMERALGGVGSAH